MNPERTHTPALIVRYRLDGAISYGELAGPAGASGASGASGEALRLTAAPWLGGVPTGHRDALERATLLAPAEPTKIICIGLNYVEHARESLTNAPGAGVPDKPLMFLKPPSAVLVPGGVVRYPAGVERLDPEGELALVIGRRACAVPEHEALSYVAGVTAFDDMSARNWQKSDGQWARAKGFDTFAPFGPCVALGLSPLDLALELRVNGEVRQRARTSQMHFGPAFLVSYVSRHFTLEPGDLIATGTPSGIAPLEPGDAVEVELEGVGVLRHSIGAREA